jgi:hypothetical protein
VITNGSLYIVVNDQVYAAFGEKVSGLKYGTIVTVVDDVPEKKEFHVNKNNNWGIIAVKCVTQEGVTCLVPVSFFQNFIEAVI